MSHFSDDGEYDHLDDFQESPEESSSTIFCSNAPFTMKFFQNTFNTVPKYDQLPASAAAQEFAFEETTGNVFCKNGVCLQRCDWLQGGGAVLSTETSERKMAEIAYFVDKLPKFVSEKLKVVYDAMVCKRSAAGICSFVDVLQIIQDCGVYESCIIVKPRLEMILKQFKDEKTSAITNVYRQTDVKNLSAQSYISLTITVLAWIFSGVPERMLVFDKTLLSGIAIALNGQEFWRFLHFCIPSFGWHFSQLYSKCFVTSLQTRPQFFHYSTGEGLAIVVWMAFQQYYTIVKGACIAYLRKQSAPEKKITDDEWVTFLCERVPSPLRGQKIDEFKSAAAMIGTSEETLYACKSMIEFEMLNPK